MMVELPDAKIPDLWKMSALMEICPKMFKIKLCFGLTKLEKTTK